MMRAGQYPQGFEAIQWAGSVEMKKKNDFPCGGGAGGVYKGLR